MKVSGHIKKISQKMGASKLAMATKDVSKKTFESAKKTRAFKKTPPFWKKMQLAGLIIIGLTGAINKMPLDLPETIQEWSKYIGTIGGSMIGIGQFAITDKTKEEQEIINNYQKKIQ